MNKKSVPVRPVLSVNSFKPENAQRLPCILDAPYFLVTSGRIAIAMAVENAGIAGGGEVLIPAYHCTSMVEPFVHAKIQPVFYKVNADLTPDLNDLRQKISDKTRCILAAHFFGFPQDLSPIVALCSQHKLLLIEDCAHTLFGEFGGARVGTTGDYAIASPMKFFPLFDGGYLASANRDLSKISLHNPSFAYQLKAVMDIFERAFHYRRLRLFQLFFYLPLKLKSALWSAVKWFGRERRQQSIGSNAADGGFGFDSSWINVRASGISNFLIRRLPRSRIIKKRRDNYNFLLNAFKSVNKGKPLYDQLPDGVVPYMFPLLIENGDSVFHGMRENGVVLYRWEDLMTDICAVSNRYGRNLLQIPCHQELSEAELNYIVSEMTRAIE